MCVSNASDFQGVSLHHTQSLLRIKLLQEQNASNMFANAAQKHIFYSSKNLIFCAHIFEAAKCSFCLLISVKDTTLNQT